MRSDTVESHCHEHPQTSLARSTTLDLRPQHFTTVNSTREGLLGDVGGRLGVFDGCWRLWKVLT